MVCEAGDEAEISALCGATTRVLTLSKDGLGSLSTQANDQPTWFNTVPRGPEDLAALTMEASAMAGVPLAGTNHTVGVADYHHL